MQRFRNTTTYLFNFTLHGGKFDFARHRLFDLEFLIWLSFLSKHCEKVVPEYEQAAAVLSTQDPPLTIAKIDITENKVITERMGIKGIPTFYFFK